MGYTYCCNVDFLQCSNGAKVPVAPAGSDINTVYVYMVFGLLCSEFFYAATILSLLIIFRYSTSHGRLCMRQIPKNPEIIDNVDDQAFHSSSMNQRLQHLLKQKQR